MKHKKSEIKNYTKMFKKQKIEHKSNEKELGQETKTKEKIISRTTINRQQRRPKIWWKL